MEYAEIDMALKQLHEATDRLAPANNIQRLDIDEIEKAVAERESAVARLSDLVARCPEAFTNGDIERVRQSIAVGKRAMEKLIEARRGGWTIAAELTQNQYFLRTFSSYSAETEQ